jgi:nucleotide-binding universal stress UspA family protein
MSSSADHQRIIVAVDGSPSGKVATDWAAREAALRHVPLTLVHVLPEPAFAMWPEPPLPQDFWDWREKHGQQILADARQVVDTAVLDSEPIVIDQQQPLAGSIIPTLVDLSKDAALIVVGCRGLGKVKRRLLGSVSSGLVHHAHCPVAVIHDEDPLMDRPAQAPVVVGIDASPASELATAIAFDAASRRGVGLVAMHSWADDEVYTWAGIDWAEQRDEGERALAEQLAGWQERYPDVVVDRQLVFGDAAEKLVAASESAQLTVVGSHGRGGFAAMLLGSVSSAVVQAARMPVIVARQA